MKHSPGPWEVQKGGGIEHFGYQVMSGDECVADVYMAQEVTADVNARLIAAAPLLLSALQQIAGNGTLGLQQHQEARTLREVVQFAQMILARVDPRA